MTDYASDFQAINLNILVPEEKPNALFSATGDSTGTLTQIDSTMKYKINSGQWQDINGENANLLNLTSGDTIYLYRSGNGTTTSESEQQSISITQALQPMTVAKTDCTTAAQNDGTITSVNDTMEYKVKDNVVTEWNPVLQSATGVTVSAGTYLVRVKGAGTVLASPAAEVTVGRHTCVSDGVWHKDSTHHWNECTGCHAVINKTEHLGGTANCQHGAICSDCQQEYGEKDPANHTGTATWITTSTPQTTHKKTYNCCDVVVVEETEHVWNDDGECTECDYPCVHSGGTATCSQPAVCDNCGASYGELDSSNHDPANTWTQENGKHYHACEYGCGTHLDEIECSGGEATCTAKAICAICNHAYGEVNAANHANLAKTERVESTHAAAGNIEYWYCPDCNKYFSDAAGTQEITQAATVIPQIEHSVDTTGWHSDENNHWNTCTCGAEMNEAAHTFGWITDKEATTTVEGSRHEECTVCHYKKDAVAIPVIVNPTPAPVTYSFKKGADGTYTKGSGAYTIEVSGDFDKFQSVSVDGKVTGTENYDAKSGSTIITFKESYLTKLTAEKHTITVNFTDGTATTSLTVKEKAAATPTPTVMPTKPTSAATPGKTPATGDNSNLILWFAMMLVGGGAIISGLFVRKRKKANR
ncbi:MAG: LPXTG cell wall anchor domain-containing protein [Blautia sp.]